MHEVFYFMMCFAESLMFRTKTKSYKKLCNVNLKRMTVQRLNNVRLETKHGRYITLYFFFYKLLKLYKTFPNLEMKNRLDIQKNIYLFLADLWPFYMCSKSKTQNDKIYLQTI